MTTSNNICECPNPPGGVVVCEADQLAICRVKNGQLWSECKGPPRPLTLALNRTLYFNWALEQITEHGHRSSEPINDSDWQMLREGVYSDPWRNLLVRFRFPRMLARIFPDLRSWASLARH